VEISKLICGIRRLSQLIPLAWTTKKTEFASDISAIAKMEKVNTKGYKQQKLAYKVNTSLSTDMSLQTTSTKKIAK